MKVNVHRWGVVGWGGVWCGGSGGVWAGVRVGKSGVVCVSVVQAVGGFRWSVHDIHKVRRAGAVAR